MLDAAETGETIERAQYDQRVPALRVDLINAQHDLRSARLAVVVLLAGNDWLGCDEVLDVLHEWMDARYLESAVFLRPTAEDEAHPHLWRTWNALPRHGRISIHLGGWAMDTVAERVLGRCSEAEFERRMTCARDFERLLTVDETLVIKLWLHLPRAELKKRTARAHKDSNWRWRLAADEWKVHRHPKRLHEVAGRYLAGTHDPACPWHVVESTDRRARNLAVGRAIRDALAARLADQSAGAHAVEAGEPPLPVPDALARVDLSSTLSDEEYETLLESLQERVAALVYRARNAELASVLVFEGWDAAGKGGVIRRLTQPLSARDYRVVPISAPTEEERAHHYLWRFWRRLPRAGSMTLFDRSWYGRVLVERVEGFARPDEWQRAYGEINTFEAQLLDHGLVLCKFWLHIPPDEQFRRFEARRKTAYKKYKLTPDDYRNRERWQRYQQAANEMFARTSPPGAPWHVLSAMDKRVARTEVLRILCEQLEGRLEKS